MTWWLASLLGQHGGEYGTKDIQVLYYGIWPWRRILNRACISISNLLENIAWQTHKDNLRPEARGPLKSGAWGGRPTCHPQTPLLLVTYQYHQATPFLVSCQHLLRQFCHPADGVNMYLQNSQYTHHNMLPKTVGQNSAKMEFQVYFACLKTSRK